jgi:hypothetical protein
MMEIQQSIYIDRPRSEVFAFMSDMRNHPLEQGSKVVLVEKTTSGDIGIGTQFRELVKMLPLVNVSMLNEVTQFKSDEQIEITWRGGGMEGVLVFYFDPHEGGTNLKVEETVHPKGVMKWAAPMVERNFRDMWEKRLNGIKWALEAA